MKRCVFFFLVMAALVSCSSKQKEEAKTEEAETPTAQNDLPVMYVKLLDGSTIQTKSLDGPLILVLFQPDCEHCQNEARQMQEHLDAFSKYKMYFVSSAPMEDIGRFANDYQLAGKPGILFGGTTVENVLNNFGSISAPSVYIYSAERKLVKSFNGEVDISVILKYL